MRCSLTRTRDGDQGGSPRTDRVGRTRCGGRDGDLGRRRAAGDRLDGRAGLPDGEHHPPDECAATRACTASRLGECRHGDEIGVGRHHHRTGRRVLRRADPGAAPDLPGRPGARPGRGGRVDRASYRYHHGARRSFRHGSGCVPPPRAQRVRGTDPRALGAGDRPDALRLRRRRMDASVASPAAPAPLLAQGRDGRAGDRLDACGIRPGPGTRRRARRRSHCSCSSNPSVGTWCGWRFEAALGEPRWVHRDRCTCRPAWEGPPIMPPAACGPRPTWRWRAPRRRSTRRRPSR